MIKTRALMDAAKAAQGIPSNYRLARVLDVPERTVQRWASGETRPDDAHAAHLAELAGFDPGVTVAAINAERAEGPMRALWTGIAERLQRASVTACVILSLGFWSGGPDGGALASTAHPEPSVVLTSLYIM